MADEKLVLYCELCRKTLSEDQFYRSRNLEKYPLNGRLPKCKKCSTLHVDNFDPSTYLWLLQELDVPYIPKEWDSLLRSYGKDPTKLKGTSILGRYLGKMQLKHFKDFRWKDTEFLQQIEEKKIKEGMQLRGCEAAEIAEKIQELSFEVPKEPLSIPEFVADVPEEEVYAASPTSSTPEPAVINLYEDIPEEDIIEISDEEKKYLITKWGRTYKINELISLEQLYAEMFNSYDIQAAGDINTLKLACKTSLKANQLLDVGDIDGAQKMTKMYDGLMKSGKWTAAQNKENEEEMIDSVGALVSICEAEGFIPRYYVDSPKDHVDKVLEDLRHYTSNLVKNESGLSSLIEIAVKGIQEEQAKIAEAANSEEEDKVAKMFDYDTPVIISDNDFAEFSDFEMELSEADLQALEESDI